MKRDGKGPPVRSPGPKDGRGGGKGSQTSPAQGTKTGGRHGSC